MDLTLIYFKYKKTRLSLPVTRSWARNDKVMRTYNKIMDNFNKVTAHPMTSSWARMTRSRARITSSCAGNNGQSGLFYLDIVVRNGSD